MAKTIKSLLRISMAIRNLGTLNGCTLAKRFIQTASSCGTRYNKDDLVSPQPSLAIPNNSRNVNFTHCNNYANIFRIVRNREETMGARDAVRALNELWRVEKTQKIEKMYEQEEFLLLCDILMRNIRHLNVSDAITAFKALTAFNVSSTSVIVQSILQMIRKSLKELTIRQIEFLDVLFTNCEKTPIIDALEVAMLIVYENNLTTQLDRRNMNALVSAYKYLCQHSQRADLIGVVIHAIRNCQQPLGLPAARSIMSFYAECDLPEVSDLIRDAQSVLAHNITQLPREALHRIARSIARKVRAHGHHYYHEGFMDACASIVISEDWGFDDAMEILNCLGIIGHTQTFLLDYIAAKCFEDPTILQSCTRAKIDRLIAGFSDADYKPVFWDSIQESVMELLENMERRVGEQSKLAIHLLCLDCYRPKLVEKIFTHCSTTLPYTGSSNKNVVLLNQAVRTLYPQYTGPWPILHIDAAMEPRPSDDFPLMETLESALGGRTYVLTNVKSSLDHFIDHVLVMRKGGFPVAINSEADPIANKHPVRQLDELHPPPDGQVILLRLVPAHGYSINSQRMKGWWSLHIRTLEALTGYTVIPIQSSMWESLPVNERMPYLMQAIRLKCDDV